MSVTETEKTPRPPLLEQVIRFLVWFSILGCIATPVVVMLMVYGRVFGSYAGRTGPSFDQINFGDSAPPRPAIVTNVLDEERGRQIAGLRVLTGFARAVDPAGGEINIHHTFCASLRKWADHFGLPFDAVRFTLLLNPGRIAPNRDSTGSDGEIAKTMYAPDLDRLCRQRASR